MNDGWRSGGKITAGYWFDRARTSGIEANFFGLESVSTGYDANSSGNPLLARPFLDATTGLQESEVAAFPGFVSGSIAANETSRLLGAGVLYRLQVGSWAGQNVSALIGYRFLQQSDSIGISSVSTSPQLDATLATSDAFKATNNFHGLDLGVTGAFEHGPWMVEWRTTLALGANFTDPHINGSTITIFGGAITSASGGLLALSSNIGNYSQTRFAAVPGFSIKGSCEFAPAWRIVAGYELFYWTNVQRAGHLIDLTVNPNLLPPPIGGGPQRPQPIFNTESLLAQGFTIGIKHDF